MPRLYAPGLACLALVAAQVSSASAAQDPLAKASLKAYLKTDDPDTTAQAVTRAREKLQTLAANEPASASEAAILLARGLDAAGVAAIVTRAKGTPIEVELKAPIGDTGRVLTMWAFQPAFEQFGGTLTQRLDYILAVQRAKLLQRASAPGADPATAERYRQVAQSPNLRFYRVKVLGTPGELRTLLKETDVAATFVTNDPERIDQATLQKARLEQSRLRPGVPLVLHRRRSDGPPTTVPQQ
jgi:hypothetical protein